MVVTPQLFLYFDFNDILFKYLFQDIIFNGHFVLNFDTKTRLNLKEFHNEIDLKRRVGKQCQKQHQNLKTTGLIQLPLNSPKCSEKSQKSKKIPLNKFSIHNALRGGTKKKLKIL